MPQNLNAYVDATTLEGAKQTIGQGPVASQEVIKMMGTNGGGFFNANSAHPYENPNAVTDLVQLVLIFSIGAGLTTAYWSEAHGNPALAQYSVDSTAGATQAGGNMEGKEVRFGIANSALF